MVRTPGYDKSGMRKGTWTREEDEKLKAYVSKYGSWNWRLIPKFAGLQRCGKSCRLRWMNYLRSDLKRGDFSKQEDDTILELHKTLGNRWSAIAAHLPGRTDNEIKNHWHTNLKKLSDDQMSSNPQVEASSSSNTFVSQQNSATDEEAWDQSLLSAEFSCMNSGPAADRSTSLAESNGVFSAEEECIELGGNLWTDPFIFEDTCYNNPCDVPLELLFEDHERSFTFCDDFLWP